MKIFIGVDDRQPLAYTVCRSSIERHAKSRVSIEPLRLNWLPISRVGLTQFTFSRYLVPYLAGFRDWALFMDADMIALQDINELQDLADPRNAVSVVKGKLRFEWPSLMLFRCDNFACKKLTPEYIDAQSTKPQTFEWCPEDRLGSLPAEWNHCVPYDDPGPAKVVHFTAGLPCWPETKGCEYSDAWWEELKHANSTVDWKTLMANSVHATPEVMGKLREHATNPTT